MSAAAPMTVHLDSSGFAVLDAAARTRYGVELHPSVLSTDAALDTVGLALEAVATTSQTVTRSQGRIVAETGADGYSAAAGAVRQARQSIGQHDGGLHIMITPSFLERLRGRCTRHLLWVA